MTSDQDELGRGERILVCFEDPSADPWAGLDGTVTLRLSPFEGVDDARALPLAAALHRCQRANREVVRRLDGVMNRTGRRPPVGIAAGLWPGAALDLGYRLHAYAVRGADVEVQVPEAIEGLLAVPIPDDATTALALGRRVARSGAQRIVGLADGQEVLVLTGSSIGGDARRALAVAAARRQHKDRAGAAAAAREALTLAGGEPEVTLQAARLLLGVGAVVEAASALGALVAREPGHAMAHVALAEALTRLGRRHASLRALEAAVRLLPGHAPLRARLAAAHMPCLDLERALAHAVDGLAQAPTDPELLALRAEAGARLRHAASPAWIEVALGADPARRARACAWWLEAGHPSRAVSALGAEDHGGRARFALWRGDLSEAAGAAGAAGEDAVGLLVGGAVDVLEGRPGDGLRRLERAASRARTDPGPLYDPSELEAWRSEALRGLGDVPGALAAANAAMTAARTYSVLAHVTRVLAVTAGDVSPDDSVDPYAWRVVADKLRSVVPGSEGPPNGRTREVHAWFKRALACFGGNRSCTPTLLRDGRLEDFHTPPHPRHEGRRLEMLLETRPADAVLAGFERLHATFPEDPLTRTYHGETLLWLGRYDDAMARFQEALRLNEETVWAWIGLGAGLMLTGRLEDATHTWSIGRKRVRFEGPTLFVYRAEAALRGGDPDAALRDLDVALADKPQRLSAWLLRAHADLARGRGEGPARVLRAVQDHAPGLWADAVTAAGSEEPDRVVPVMLASMKGNRSSSMPTWLAEGELRFATWGRHLVPREVFADFAPSRPRR